MQGNRKSSRVGLARALSKLGYCSRSTAGELIRAGRVRLNGSTPRNPETPVRLGKDRIEVDGSAVAAEEKQYWMVNKPRGLVTTAADDKGRATVYSLLPRELPWMGPVGRLDQASEGLLLFTNDSEWAAAITATESHLDKTYHVQIETVAGDGLLKSLTDGIKTAENEVLRAKQARLLRFGEKNSWLEIVLDEGKNRQIRRMLSACDVQVLRLVRVAIGPLQLAALAKGQARALTKDEKASLDRTLQAARVQRTMSSATGKHQ